MANLFQIGYGGGPPKAIDYSKALDPLAEKIGARLKESKAKTDALINNMPQGVPIDKVPEQLRGQVTDFLTQNKQAYVDASKVIASGIPSTDQRYIDAVSTINQVDAKFKNLSNTLEDIALKRQAALDGRDHSSGSLDWEIGDHEDLANGDMYSKFQIQDDGGFTYQSNDNVTKNWKDYSNTFQTSNAGQEGFFSLEEMALKDGDNGRDFNRRRFENRFDSLTKGLKNKGARDFVFADDDFIAQKTGTEVGTEEFENAKKQLVNKGNFDELLVEYKKYGVDELEKVHKLAVGEYNKKLNKTTPGRDNFPTSYGQGYITRTAAENIVSDIKNKKPTQTYDKTPISYDKDSKMYVDAEGNTYSNYDILRGHEIWDQGYRVEEFDPNNVNQNYDFLPENDISAPEVKDQGLYNVPGGDFKPVNVDLEK